MTTFRYKQLQSQWGILIEMDVHRGTSLNENEKVLVLDPSIFLTAMDRHFMNLGWQAIKNKIPDGVCIFVQRICYNVCDYQEEGLACALMGAIGRELMFDPPEVPVTWNPEKNRYVFDFDVLS